MQDLRITLLETEQYWEDKSANFNNYSRLLGELSTDLVLLPEMFQTGFTMNAAEVAEPFQHSESIAWLRQQALKFKTAIYTSLIIEDHGHYYNRGIFMFPDGTFQHYNKRKLFSLAGEDKHFNAGNKEVIVEYMGWKINLQICYDLRFPENIRNRMEADGKPAYDLLLYVANWPERRVQHWSALLPARAIENQCFVAGVNRIGRDENGLEYNGQSVIIDPFGNSPETVSEYTKTTVINYTTLNEIREKLPFLKDR